MSRSYGAVIAFFAVNLINVGLLLQGINPTLFGTLSLLELLGILVNAPGVLYAAYNTWDARQDLKYVQREPGHSDEDCVIANGSYRRERVNLTFQAGLLSMGLVLAFVPPPAIPQVATAGSLAVIAIFLGGSLLLSWCSWRDHIDRKLLRRRTK